MKCGACFTENDQDAVFCTKCGSTLAAGQSMAGKGRRKPYVYALLLLPALLIATAVGYYKFILPLGIAAVVNNEEISLAEVDGMLNGTGGGQASGEMRIKMRYAVLSDLITERIAWQEAKKAGISVSPAEIGDAYARAQMSSGKDPAAFQKGIVSQYGSDALFRAALERRTGIRKFIAERFAADTADPVIVDSRANRWLRDAASRSAVRIALTEQAPASGCGCCNNGPGAADPSGAAGGGTEPSVSAREAQRAVLAYWTERHGAAGVETKLTDFGCHIQVDIIKEKKIAKSLRYQNGVITEM